MARARKILRQDFELNGFQLLQGGIPFSPGGGVTDHGALTGLLDDDHPQYALDTDLTPVAAAAVQLATNVTSGRQPQLAALAGAVPVDNGDGTQTQRKLTTDDLGTPFTITGFSRNGAGVGSFPSGAIEIGDTITDPRFTATYSDLLQNPLTLANTQAGGPDAILLAASASFGYNNFNASGLPARTFTRTVPNQSVTWTLSAKSVGGITKTAQITNSWQPKVYWDNRTIATYNQAFIESLVDSGSPRLQSGRGGSYVFGAGSPSGTYVYFAWPTSYSSGFNGSGSVTSPGPSVFPCSIVATGVSVTNTFGVITSYDIIRSDFEISAAFTLTVS